MKSAQVISHVWPFWEMVQAEKKMEQRKQIEEADRAKLHQATLCSDGRVPHLVTDYIFHPYPSIILDSYSISWQIMVIEIEFSSRFM